MSRNAPSLAHRLEYLLFAGATAAGRLLGPAAAGLGAAVGRLGYSTLRIRRRVVEHQLRLAFPERDRAWIRRTARAAYAHLGREAMSLLRLAYASHADVLDRTAVDGLDEVRAALAAGNGVVLVTGHLGNWEIGGAALAARGIPIDIVVQRQANPLFDNVIRRARERLGMRVIDRRHAPRLALRALRDGRVVAFVADQDARRAGAFVPFFGRHASTHRGPALLALRAGAPMFLGVSLRTPDDRYLVRLQPVPRPEGTDQARELVDGWTAAFTARLEAAIRAAPDQYLWHHRRWKTAPPEEQATGGQV